MWQEWTWFPEDRNPCPGFWDHALDTWISSSPQSQPLLPHGFCGWVLMSQRNCLSLEKSPHPCPAFDPHLSPPDPQYKHFFQTKPFWRSERHRDSNCSCSPRIFFLSAVFVQRSFPMTTWPRAQNILNQTPHDGFAKDQLPFNGPTLRAEASKSWLLRVSLIIDLSTPLSSLDKGLPKDGQGSSPHQNSALSTPHLSLDAWRRRQQCPTSIWKPHPCSRGRQPHPDCSLRIPRLNLIPSVTTHSSH